MTLVMPDTDLSQQIMEELAPPCEAKTGCSNAATWVVKVTNTTCGCCFTFLICDPCKNELLETMQDTTRKMWSCVTCGHRWGPAAYSDDLNLELEKL